VHFFYSFAYITVSTTLKWSNYYLAKIQNTELLACAVSFQFPGDSEDSDGGSDNGVCGDKEDDENRITDSSSPYSTAVLLTVIKVLAIDYQFSLIHKSMIADARDAE
jgi:hypothetical protein